jgi:hypothetical protein
MESAADEKTHCRFVDRRGGFERDCRSSSHSRTVDRLPANDGRTSPNRHLLQSEWKAHHLFPHVSDFLHKGQIHDEVVETVQDAFGTQQLPIPVRHVLSVANKATSELSRAVAVKISNRPRQLRKRFSDVSTA